MLLELLEMVRLPMRSSLVAVVLASSLAACSTTSSPGTASYAPVEQSAFVSGFSQSTAAQPVRIIAKRDPGFVGVALQSVLTVDGVPVVRIRPGEYAELLLSPGEHLFGVQSGEAVGRKLNAPEIAINGSPDSTHYVRLFPQPGMGIVIARSSN